MKQWLWDSKKRIYVDRLGDRLTDKDIREALDEYIESTQKSIAREVAKYTSGNISAFTLFTSLDEEISALHGASGSIAYGGLEQMNIEKWGRINERLQTELGYLGQFRMDVARAANLVTGETVLSTEGIANRAGLYAEAAYAEYMNQVVEREGDSGVTLGRRVTEGDGAVCDGCEAAATEEFIPLDDIPFKRFVAVKYCFHAAIILPFLGVESRRRRTTKMTIYFVRRRESSY